MRDAGPFSLASLYEMLGKNTEGACLYRVAKPRFTSGVAGHMAGSVSRSKLNGSFHLLRGAR